jgi:ABC-type Zn uptake system ZnuABC Zn-binding protein ZnuA
MHRRTFLLTIAGVACGPPRRGSAAPAPLRAVTSSTDLAWVLREIGGDRVQATSFFQGHQEPELWVDEVFPSWMVRASRARLLARIGLFADPWMDTVLEGARNPAVAPGGPGHLDASEGIAVLEVPPGRVDRTLGEIHVQGNPHYLLDPANMAIVAEHARQVLTRVSPADADRFATNARDLRARLDAALARWAVAARPLQGARLAAYHRTWSYFARRYGLEVVGYCEPRPGIEPSPADVRRLTEAMASTGARLIVHEPVYSPRIPRTVAAEVGRQTGTAGRVVLLPAHVGGVPEARDYFALIDTLIARLIQGLS